MAKLVIIAVIVGLNVAAFFIGRLLRRRIVRAKRRRAEQIAAAARGALPPRR